MINKYTNKQRGLLAVIMAMVMVFAGAAFVAAEVDATTSIVEDGPNTEEVTYVAKIGDKGYETLQEAINAATGETPVTITLQSNVVGQFTIEADKNVIIDLNGYTIKSVNTDGNSVTSSIITNMGTLTIKDSSEGKTGKILLNSAGYGTDKSQDSAIYNNEGTMVIDNISIEKTKKAYYTVNNCGNLTINGGSITCTGLTKTGSDPSLVRNNGTLEINGGTFNGGTGSANTIKNEEYSKLTINGGTFYGAIGHTVVVWGDAIINGGTFYASENEYPFFIAEWKDGNGEDISASLTINDANIDSKTNKYIVAGDVDGSKVYCIGDVTIADKVSSNVVIDLFEGAKLSGSLSFGDSKITFTDGIAGKEMKVSKGSVVLEGSVSSGKITVVSGTFEVKGNLPCDVDVKSGATLAILEDAVVSGAITNNGIVELYTEITGTTITGGTVAVAPGISYTATEGQTVVSTNALGEILGISKDLDTDLTVNTKTFLADDLTILEGITLTVKGCLDLNGKELTVKGTLVVENNGYITTTSGGKIAIGPKGTIVNDGIIGKDESVMVHLIGDEGNMVSVEGAIGLGFGQIKKVINDEPSYTLSISGDVKKKADAQPKITVTGDVTVVDTLSIGNGVTLAVNDGATLTVSKNALLEITSKGQINGEGEVALASGSEVVLDGESNMTFTAKTGKYLTSEENKPLSTTSLTTYNAKGLVLAVKSTSQYDDELEADVTEVRFIVAGALDAVIKKNDNDQIITDIYGMVVDGTYTTAERVIGKYVGIYIDDTLTIGKDIDVLAFYNDAVVTVNGTVTYAGDKISEVLNALGNAVVGTYYAIEATSVEGAKTTTHYIKSFDAAFVAIDTAVEKTITVYGDVEIASDMTVLADQIIEGAATYTIDEEAVLTLENDSEFNAGSIIVKGTFVVKVDATCDEDVIKYNAMSKDSETGDVTYYGFLAALNNAKEGDVIEISEKTEVEDSFTIPAGVTIKILDDGELVAGKNLNVAGTLINEGKVSVAGETTVSGNVDLTEGTSAIFTDDITVSGEIVTSGKYNGTNMNGAYYINDDEEYVYTTPAKAVEGISGKDVGREVTIVGEVSDSTALALDNMTLRIEGEAELGDVTISKSKVVIGAGPLSGTIIGNYGAEETTGAVNDVVVILRDAQYMDIENSSKANAENVKVWSTTIDSTYNDNILSGEVVVDKGVLTVKGELKINDITNGTETKVNTIIVSEDAGLLVPKDSILTINYNEDKALLTVNGTLDIDGTFNIVGDVVINGSMDVTPGKNLIPTVIVDNQSSPETTGNLIITGDLVIGESEDYNACVFTIKGILTIGDKPTSIGTTGSLAGPVNNDGGYIVAYDGADLSAAKIDWNNDKSNAKSTTFNINGQPYMTVYTDANVMYNAVLGSADIELAGYTIANITDVTKWYTDADLTENATDNKIGTYEDLYFKAAPIEVTFQVSVGTGISLYIDDVKVISTTNLAVGTHSISAVVDPGYKGEVTISFNGVAVTDGKIVVTPEMTSASYDGLKVISATGEITADSGTVIVEPSGEDDGMELTDILLIVLVVLIVIMAIIVALRMMRS